MKEQACGRVSTPSRTDQPAVGEVEDGPLSARLSGSRMLAVDNVSGFWARKV